MGLWHRLFTSAAAPAHPTSNPQHEVLLCAQRLYSPLTIPVLLTDLAGHIIFLNPALQQLLGTGLSLLQVKAVDFNPLQATGYPLATLLQALDVQPPLQLAQTGRQQAVMALADQHWSVQLDVLADPQGQPAGYCLQFSARPVPVGPVRQQATALAYRQLCEALPNAAMLVDQHQTIVYANPVCLQTCQTLQAELVRFLPDFNSAQLTGYAASRLLPGLGVRADSWQSGANIEQPILLGEHRLLLVVTTLAAEQAADSFRLVQLIAQHQPHPAQQLLGQLGAHLCLFQLDAGGKLSYLNEAMAQLVEGQAEELTGKDFVTLWSNKAAQPQRCKQLLADLKHGESVRDELLLATQQQSEVWLAVQLFPLQDAQGKWTGAVGVAQNISVAKLEKIDRIGQMNAINLTQAVIEFTLEGVILAANPNFLQTLGYQLDEVKGRHHSLFVDEQFKRSADYQMFWQRLRAGEFFVDEFKRIGKGGKEVWIQASYNPIFDADGKPFKVVKYATDITNRKTVVNEIKRVMTELSAGDLRTRIEQPFAGEFAELGQAISSFIENLRNIITDINQAAETIKLAATEISEGNTDLSSRTEQQAASLEETASSMEELTGTVRQNSDNSRQANVLAAKACDVAVSGGQLIDQVVTTMASINESAQKISDIIGVIDGIAFQTNILALNAAVEAARAGEQGRGFAVVASEVRTLAQRSANAAKDIKGLISDSVNKIRNGNELVDRSGSTMKEVVVSIKRVNDLMAEIASASAEQASGIDEINKAVTQMDDMTQQNAALVEQAAAAAESLLSQAEQLYDHVAMFTVSETAKVAARVVSPLVKRPAALPVKSAGKPAKPAKTTAKRAALQSAAPKLTAGEEAEWEAF